MGIDKWCSRSWDGPLCLVVALAGAPGCLGQVADPPSASPNASASSEAALVPALVPAQLVEQFAGDAPPQSLCGDPLLGGDFELDDSGLPTLYVDVASDAAAPDGSLAAPFRTLTEALLVSGDALSGSSQALTPARRVLVASGYYDEDVAIPPGTLLFGGYDRQSWEEGADPSVIGGSVYVGTATAPAGIVSPEGYVITGTTENLPRPSAAPLTALRHFEVSGGVSVVSGARALLRDNVIAPLFYGTTGDPPGMRRAMAVWVNVATVRADHNRLSVPADDPASISSAGFFTWDSCAWITQNEITDYRSPIYFYQGLGAAATFNVMQRAENGVGADGNQALIAGNFIGTYMPLSGCVYAIHMHGDAHPDVRDNTIVLTHSGNRGILEADGASHPTALLGNRFYSPQSSSTLYVDHRGAVDPQLITSVGALNALAGVPAIGGNTFARVTAP